MVHQLILETPIGNVRLHERDGILVEIEFQAEEHLQLNDTDPGPLLKKLAMQLEAYFRGEKLKFDLKLQFPGTPFQQRVWHALQKIPVGQTRTYGDLARQLDSSARAVGNACRRNPFPIIVPCHRVVAASGIGGFAGQVCGTEIQIKRWLLQHEGVETGLPA